MIKEFESDNIFLRPFCRADIPVWTQWFNDPAVTHYLNKGTAPNTEEMQTEFFEKISRSKTDVQYAIVHRSDQHLVGTVGIHEISWIHRRGKVSVVVGNRSYWGKGVASEAIRVMTLHGFTKLGLNKLFAGVWEGNLGCQKAFEKNGYVVEGNLKEMFFCQDRFVGEMILGLTRGAWKKET